MRFAHYWIGIAILSAMLLPGRGARADEIYDPYNSWNGYKVYLSPARHSDAGNRGECGNNNENNMAYNSSWHATNGWHYNDVYNDTSAYRNLRARGYQVRIGTGTLQSAIDNSNAWGANLHIPMHSNASGNTDCNTTNSSAFGTVVIYRDGNTNGQSLANQLKDKVGYKSPGTNDYTCYNPNHPCTLIDLGELRLINATAAYQESEFHNWWTGVNWINDYSWPWRMGWAIDQFLGYPR
jgi:hypothetical protein